MQLEFGKFKGYDLDHPEVTTQYLEWLHGSMVTTAAAIEAELARREQIDAENLTLAERMVVAGFRALAKEHKDDPDMLRDLNGARAALEGVLEEYFVEQAHVEAVRNVTKGQQSKDLRNRGYAAEILRDKTAGADDVAWAKKILGKA